MENRKTHKEDNKCYLCFFYLKVITFFFISFKYTVLKTNKVLWLDIYIVYGVMFWLTTIIILLFH